MGVDSRIRCRCSEGRCACTRDGRPVPAPSNLPAVVAAAGRLRPAGASVPTRAGRGLQRRPFEGASAVVLHQRAYFTFAEATGDLHSPMGDTARALTGGYVQATRAGRYDDAEVLLRALRRHGEHVGRLRARAALDAVEVRAFGAAGALVRRLARRERAQRVRAGQRLDALYAQVHGPDLLTLQRLRRRVDTAAGRRG